MSNGPSSELTKVLEAIGAGDAGATDQLLPLVYKELHALAERQFRAEPAGLTLQPTALVHEAYLRLMTEPDARWSTRGHFFVAAATAMRRILVERARQRAGPQRGGGRRRVPLDDAETATMDEDSMDTLELDDALTALERHEPRMARIVMLRYFAGLSVEDTAAALATSARTVRRDWAYARAWLFERMSGKKADDA